MTLDELRAKMQEIQAEIIKDTGTLDQLEYRKRLKDKGYLELWEQLSPAPQYPQWTSETNR